MRYGTPLKPYELARLRALIEAVRAKADQIAVTIVADDSQEADHKPALKNVHFLERLDNDQELNRVSRIFHEFGIACQVVFGFREFMEKALVNDLFPQNSVIKVVIDRTEGGGHRDGFGPARRSTGALLCQQFGFHYAHSDAYSAAITRHKHHQAMILKTAQLPVPNTWSFDVRRGWSSGKPERGLKVICKSTFEAWSVGVSENTVGPFDEVMEDTIRILAEEIGQPVCVQEFIQGQEIYSLVLDSDVPMMVGVAEAKSSNGPKRNGSYLAFNDHHRPGGIVYNRVDGLSQECLDKISRAATKTFLLLSMSVVGRIDFRVDSLGHPYIIDIADNPGTSLSSSLVYILSEVGFTIGEIPILLLGLSLARSNIIPA